MLYAVMLYAKKVEKNDIRGLSRIQRVEWVLATKEWILFWTFWLQVNCAIGKLKCLLQSWKIEFELGTTGRSIKTGLKILPIELVPEVMSMRVISDMDDVETWANHKIHQYTDSHNSFENPQA